VPLSIVLLPLKRLLARSDTVLSSTWRYKNLLSLQFELERLFPPGRHAYGNTDGRQSSNARLDRETGVGV